MAKIKQIIMLMIVLLVPIVCPSLSHAYYVTENNYLTECRIGPLGLKSPFDMNELNSLFGEMTKPAIQGGPASNPMVLYFNNARIIVIDNKIWVVAVTTNKGKNGVSLTTPKGISVGDSLDKVFIKYGAPDSTHKSTLENTTSYTYGSFEINLIFTVNEKNKVTEISIGMPTC
nr:MAG TPA: CAP-associated protein [Caudoviricetes sp.]